MPNVQISDLAFAVLPLVGSTTFFEVEATEGGVVVSRRIAADDLTISVTSLVITGTSTDDPSIGAGTFDGRLLWQNANALQTGVFGFDPAGDNFIWSNDAEGGFHQIAIRDGTVLVETVAAAAGGLLVQNLSTGAGLERVLTTADLAGAPSLGSLTDVTLTAPATGAVLYKSAGDWLDTPGILIDPAADVKLHQATVEVFRTLPAANGGAEANNTLTGAGFERVLTASDAFTGIIEGSSTDSPETPGGTWDGVLRFDNANSLQTARVGFDPAGDTFFVQPTVEGGRVIIGGRSPGSPGVLRESLIFDFDTGGLPAGSTRFFETNGTAEQMRLDTGVSAVTEVANVLNNPASGLAQHGQFRITNSLAQQAGEFGFPASGGLSTTMRVKNFVHGGPIELVGETAAGLERVLIFTDPDQAGPIIFGLTDNNPATDASIQDARLTFRNPSLQNIWQIGFLEGTNDFSLKLFQDTGTLRLRGSSAASADTLLAIFDPVADAKLFQAGAEVFRTVAAASGGAQANNTSTGAGFERVLTTADIAAAASLGSLTDVTLTAPATGAVLYKSAGDWLDTPAITIDPVGAVTVFNNLVLVLGTQTTGIEVRGTLANDPTAAGVQDANIDLFNATPAQVGHIGYQGGISLDIKSFIHSNSVTMRLLGEQATGAEINFIDCSFTGVVLYDQDDLSAETNQLGWIVHSQAPQTTTVVEMDQGVNIVGELFFSAGEFAVEAGIDVEALMNLYATDTALNEVIMATLDAQVGPVTLNHSDAAGSVVGGLRTASLANGGGEVNNTVTGAGFERVLGVSDRTVSSVYTPTNVSTDRAYDANATTLDEIADVLGTLIADLQTADVIQ